MRKYYKIKNKNPAKGAIDMDAIDVRDLPEEEARLIQKLVDHLKSLRKTSQAVKEEDWGHVAMTAFTHDWDNDKDAAYDNWQAHYHVSAG